MITVHGESIRLAHSFDAVFRYLQDQGGVETITEAGTSFSALASHVTKGRRAGEPVIRFFQESKEYSRAYICCWGHSTNCNKTLVGMYCRAIDKALRG